MYQYDVDGGASSVALSCHLMNSGIWFKSKNNACVLNEKIIIRNILLYFNFERE
jgi:hypothetical protein